MTSYKKKIIIIIKKKIPVKRICEFYYTYIYRQRELNGKLIKWDFASSVPLDNVCVSV